MKIKSIKKINYKGDVYNLRVANNHNYVADNMIVSNCHGVNNTALQLKGILTKCENSKFRVGLTGTLPKNKLNLLTLFGFIGPLLFKQESSDLIDRGILSKINIISLLARYPDDIIEKTKQFNYLDETNLVRTYKPRYKILDFIFNNTPDGHNTLILCSRIDHLKDTEQYILNHINDKYSLYIIYGKVKADQREAIRQLTEKGSNVIILSTYKTMSLGVNIKKLHQLIFWDSHKKHFTTLQAIGRGLRKHLTKSKLILWDIVDDLRRETRQKTFKKNYYFKQWKERMVNYTDQKFKVITKSFKL